jgi:large repetitive protein
MTTIGRILQMLVAVLTTLALGPVGSAFAAPPSLEIVSPQMGETINTDAPTINGTTTDSTDSITVAIYAAAEPLVAAQTLIVSPASSGSWSVQATPLADGRYAAKAEQVNEGEAATPAETKFTLDTTPPAVTLDAVPALTNNPRPTFAGNGGEAPGDAGSVSVVVRKSGLVVAEASAAVSAGRWSYTPPSALVDGTYSVTVTQSDAAGNVTTLGPTTFKIDTRPPEVTIAKPSAGELLKVSRPVFAGDTSSGDTLPITLEIFTGGSPSGTPEVLEVPHGSSSWTTGNSGPELTNGTYTVRARQTDAAGNIGEAPAPITFTVDSPSPTVTLSDLPPFTRDSAPAFSGNADTSSEAKQEVTLTIWPGNSTTGSPIEVLPHLSVSGGTWAVGASADLPDGTYTAQAMQPAEWGNPSGFSNVSIFTVDTVAPAPTLVAPPESSGVETVSGTAGNEPGDDRQIVVELFSGAVVDAGQALETITVNRTEGAWSATFAGLASGRYTAIARQSDEAGNSGESSPGAFVVVAPASAASASPSVAPMITNTIVVSVPTSPSSLVLMQPFPIVRIAGVETSYGAQIKLLTVQAPPASTVTVTCKGHGCKTKSESRVATAASKGKSGTLMIAFPRFERALRVGAVLQIRVSKAGEIGKYTSFTIRRHKLPVRTDACLNPASPAPIACPTA